jgi:hypothetical protein
VNADRTASRSNLLSQCNCDVKTKLKLFRIKLAFHHDLFPSEGGIGPLGSLSMLPRTAEFASSAE